MSLTRYNEITYDTVMSITVIERYARELGRRPRLPPLLVGERMPMKSRQSLKNPAVMTPVRPALATRYHHLFLSLIYLIWGSTYLAIRYAAETIPPLYTAAFAI